MTHQCTRQVTPSMHLIDIPAFRRLIRQQHMMMQQMIEEAQERAATRQRERARRTGELSESSDDSPASPPVGSSSRFSQCSSLAHVSERSESSSRLEEPSVASQLQAAKAEVERLRTENAELATIGYRNATSANAEAEAASNQL